MALKQVPPGLSFSKMREKHAPKADLRKPVEASQRPSIHAVSPPEPPAEDRLPQALSEVPPVADAGTENEPVGLLPAELDHEGQGGCQVAPPDDGGREPIMSVVAPVRPVGRDDVDQDADSTGSATQDQAKVKMNVRVPLPAEGVSDAFDGAKAIYGERVAFKAILDKALSGYEAALLAGRVVGPLPPYATAGSGVQTSRVMTQKAYVEAKARLDPLDILGPSTFGASVLKNALNWYFSEKR